MAEITIENSSERRSRMTGVIWGRAKTGKTTLLTSLPGKKLFVMVDPDGDTAIPDDPSISIMRLYEHDNGTVKRFLIDKLPTYLRKNEEGFESVVIDSLSTFGQICLEDAIASGVGAGRDFKPSLEAPGLAAYGARTQNIVKMVNANLRATGSVGMHCFFTAHEDEASTDDKGNLLGVTWTLSGKAINGIGLNVSEIWHLRMLNGKWTLSISPCRGREPMGSRLFDMTGDPEFQVKFIPEKGTDQPHSIATWYNQWVESGRKKLPLPK